MPRLRVLWLSHLVPYPPQGGAAQRSYHLLREASRRHSVHLVALNQRARLGGTQKLFALATDLTEVFVVSVLEREQIGSGQERNGELR